MVPTVISKDYSLEFQNFRTLELSSKNLDIIYNNLFKLTNYNP